jgi:hypothetical protein
MGPPSMTEGDEIWMLHGGDVLFVLLATEPAMTDSSSLVIVIYTSICMERS